MKKKFLFGFLVPGLLLLSCSEKQEVVPQARSLATDSKIINTKSNANSTAIELLVKFDSVPNEQELDEFMALGVSKISPTLKSTKGKEELEAKFGLNRWYTIELNDESDIEVLAHRFAQVQKVSVVQYNTAYSRPKSVGEVVPYTADSTPEATAFETKASGLLPFNDPYLVNQWSLANKGNASIAPTSKVGADINVYEVWNSITCGDKSIIVAIIDEGVKYTHPDLAANMWVNPGEQSDGTDSDGNGYIDDIYGYNFVSNGPITWDKKGNSGHGTHCAGIVAAVGNNGKGISGVAGGSGNNDGVRIMSCQVFDGYNGGLASQAATAIKYAADNGASIISCSFGYPGGAYLSDSNFRQSHGLEYDTIQYFEASCNNDVLDGNISIFSSGNDNSPYANYPGAISNIISVSSYGPDFLPAYYTNYGPGCNITAPGGNFQIGGDKACILSTVPSELYDGDYSYMQGTSQACPHVSGVVALGLSYAKKLGKKFSLQTFKEMLLASTNDFETTLSSAGSTNSDLAKYRGQMGTGAIDAWRFMMKIEGTPCLTAVAGEKQWLDLSTHFGSSSVNLTYLDIECSEQEAAKVGLKEAPEIKYGRLYIHPTKCGSFKMKIHAIGGGNELGGENSIGGMEFSQEISVVVRSTKSTNGGWL